MKLSGLNICGDYAKKNQLNLVLVVVLVLKSKALYGSFSELQSKVPLRGWERVNWNRGGAGGGESRDWNLNGRLAKLLSEIRSVADAKVAKFPKINKAFFAWVY